MHESPPLWRWSAVDLAAAIQRRDISCVEATQAAIDRMHAANPRVNAVTLDLSKDAVDAAKRADAIAASGVRLGALHGVPVTIKDLAITKDMPTQNGSLIFKHFEA